MSLNGTTSETEDRLHKFDTSAMSELIPVT